MSKIALAFIFFFLIVQLDIKSQDITPPLLQFTYPDNYGAVYEGDGFFVMTFNEDVQLSLGDRIISLYDGGGSEVWSVPVSTLSFNGNDVYFDIPTYLLYPLSQYYFNIDPGSIEDSSGNSFIGITDNSTWTFFVEPYPTQIFDRTPNNGAENVSADCSCVQLSYSDWVYEQSGIVSLYRSDNSLVESITTGVNDDRIDISGQEVNIDFLSEFEKGVSYYITVSDNAFFNSYGLPVDGIAINEWSFTIEQVRPFITTWLTTTNNESITIPTSGSGYNYTVDWGDGSIENNLKGSVSHEYALPGTHEVSITGDFPRIRFASSFPNRDKILTIEQWGDIRWSSMQEAFTSCKNLTYNATDVPDLSNVSSLSEMFKYAYQFNGAIGNWDVSTITDMSEMFWGALIFDQDISSWDVSSVTDMSWMLTGAKVFNQNISNWDVGSVTTMYNMFYNATLFNQDIGNWDVSNVTSMFGMFRETDFNQDIGNWDVGEVTEFRGMFLQNSGFNKNIGNWDVSKAVDMRVMFAGATSFNQDLSNWSVGNVTDFLGMFSNSTSFNQDIGDWDVSKSEIMDDMFQGATSFNYNLNSWDVSKVNTMAFMFSEASSFNQPLDDWDVSNVADMSGLFSDAIVFNQDISSWNIGRVERMEFLFNNSNMDSNNYDAVLNKWSALPSLQSGVELGAGGLSFCAGEPGRSTLIEDYGWIISGDIKGCTNTTPTDILLSKNDINELNEIGDLVGVLTTEDADEGESFTYNLVAGPGGSDNSSFSIEGNRLLANEQFDFESKDQYFIRLSSYDGIFSIERELIILINNETNLPQTISFSDISNKVYGNEDFILEASSNSGLDVLFEAVNSPVIISGNEVQIVGAGEVIIEMSQPGDNDYAPSFVQRTFSIAKAPLIVAASNSEMTYGEEMPFFNYSYSGFLFDDTPDLLIEQPVAFVDEYASNGAGIYPIYLEGGVSDNYEFNFVNGELKVNPKDVETIIIGTTFTNGGTVYSVDLDGNNANFLVDFRADETLGKFPFGKIARYGNYLWGTTRQGGSNGAGVIYKLDFDGNFQRVYDFELITGNGTEGGLVESNNLLWGATPRGGVNGSGVIYNFDPENYEYNVVHEFSYTSAGGCYGGLLVVDDQLWGMSYKGGDHDKGVIFKINNDGTGYTVVHSFNEINGASPTSTLLEYNDEIYGVTKRGGVENNGVIFKISKDGNVFEKIHDFVDVPSWGGPESDLLIVEGQLWGSTRLGTVQDVYDNLGFVYRVNLDGSEFEIVHEFEHDDLVVNQLGVLDGSLSYYNNKIFGLTSFGGADDGGVIFTIDQDGSNFQIFKELSDETGTWPIGSLFFMDRNESPTYSQIPAQNYLEDSEVNVIKLSDHFDDFEDGSNGLSYEIIENSNDQLVSGALEFPGLLSLTLFPNVFGSSEITVLATDSHGNEVEGTFSINVKAVADELSITSATAIYGSYNEEGLVISKGPSDGEEVPYFKVYNISNGFLYRSDGTTLITENEFLELSEAVEGLKFVPTSMFDAGFLIQGATGPEDEYLGGSAVQSSIVVEKARLEVIIDSKSIVYGDPLPELSYSIEGFVLDDNINSITQLPTLSTLAGPNSDAGVYEIKATEDTSENYYLDYQNGTLTIDKAKQEIRMDEIEDKRNTDPPFSVSIFSTAELDLNIHISGPATLDGRVVTLTGGIGEVKIIATQGGNQNFNPAENSISFNVSGTCEGFGVSIDTIEDNFCFGEESGVISISAIGGSGNYSYVWSNNETTSNISGLKNGNYSVIVTDEDIGCSKEIDFEITSPEQLNLSGVIMNLNGENAGKIDIAVNGGVEPYKFEWSTGELTEDVDVLETGEYSVNVIDDNNCVTSGLFVVSNITSIKHNYDEPSMVLFPNPVNELLKVQLINIQTSQYSIQVIDMLGNTLLFEEYDFIQDFVLIDMSAYLNGQYLIKLNTESATKIMKIIKY